MKRFTTEFVCKGFICNDPICTIATRGISNTLYPYNSHTTSTHIYSHFICSHVMHNKV